MGMGIEERDYFNRLMKIECEECLGTGEYLEEPKHNKPQQRK